MNIDKINHISYAVSYKELISIWVDLYFRTENIVVIYDPLTHIEYLRELKIEIDDLNLYESKIMVVHLVSVEEAIFLCKYISCVDGPYSEVWSLGKYITDNLEK
tara:strand:- start:114 stop:425 length:312 start_codon:yes stop_codon:yes gene_type:complete